MELLLQGVAWLLLTVATLFFCFVRWTGLVSRSSAITVFAVLGATFVVNFIAAMTLRTRRRQAERR